MQELHIAPTVARSPVPRYLRVHQLIPTLRRPLSREVTVAHQVRLPPATAPPPQRLPVQPTVSRVATGRRPPIRMALLLGREHLLVQLLPATAARRRPLLDTMVHLAAMGVRRPRARMAVPQQLLKVLPSVLHKALRTIPMALHRSPPPVCSCLRMSATEKEIQGRGRERA